MSAAIASRVDEEPRIFEAFRHAFLPGALALLDTPSAGCVSRRSGVRRVCACPQNSRSNDIVAPSSKIACLSVEGV